MKLLKSWRVWLHGLGAAVIGGGASAAGSWAGMAAAKSAGVDVPALNLKALGILFGSGALTSALAYLKQSPLPKDEENAPTPGTGAS